MRSLGPICILLTSAGCLAAKTEVQPGECLGGWLGSVQQDSITLKFNDKIITTPLAPGAEIWRRGVDLESPRQLVVGDEIYMKCVRTAQNGPVLASIVAAVEKDDAVLLKPHPLVDYAVCGGHLVNATRDSISLKSDDGVCTMRITPDTKIWRGGDYRDTSALKLGDEVMARMTVAYPGRQFTAEQVEANVAKAEGKVLSARPDRIVIKDEHTRFTVLLDAQTKFDLDQGKLERGACVMAIGLDLGHNTFRATSVVVEK